MEAAPEIQQPAEPTLSLALTFTIFITGALAFVHVYSIQSILPILMHDFNADAPTAGSTVGATVLAIAIMSPFMGMISDIFGRKIFVVGAIFFLGIPTIGMFFVQNIEQMWWLRFLQGLSVPGITVVLLAYIGEEFFSTTRIRLMSVYVTGTVFGGFMGRFLVGYLTEYIGWRSAFLIVGLLSLGGAFMVLRTLPKSQYFVAQPKILKSFQTLAHHIKNRHIIAACLLGFCVLFSLVSCFTYINLYLDQPPYSLSSAQLANIFAVYLLGIVITPLSAKLIVKLGANRTILFAVGMSVFGVLLTMTPSLTLIIIGLAMMSSGVFITQSATINYIAYHATEGRSLASGLYYMAYYTGGFIGAWLCGHAFEIGGWTVTAVTIVGVQVLAMLIGGILMAKKPKEEYPTSHQHH